MSLDTYCLLGRTGLRVSRLALGTMTFGKEWGWGSDEETSRAVFNHYLDAGGNFLDTADIYTLGTSESWLGKFVAERKARDRVVIATKFTQNMQPGNPNGGGNGRKNILRAVEGSLRRLNTDYIDLYILHQWDALTPVDEVIRTMDDLVRSGKVRHVGLSDVPAWYAASMQTTAELRGFEPISSIQMQYSLVERNIEHEFVALGLAKGMSITAWSPLASGLLSGKYRSGGAEQGGRGRLDMLAAIARKAEAPKKKGSANSTLDQRNERSAVILAEVENVAREIGRSVAQVALNWAMNRPCIASVLIGASRLEQLEENLAAADFDIPPALLARLDAVSHPETPFPYTFFGGDWQQRIRGGRTVLAKPPGYYRDGLIESGNP